MNHSWEPDPSISSCSSSSSSSHHHRIIVTAWFLTIATESSSAPSSHPQFLSASSSPSSSSIARVTIQTTVYEGLSRPTAMNHPPVISQSVYHAVSTLDLRDMVCKPSLSLTLTVLPECAFTFCCAPNAYPPSDFNPLTNNPPPCHGSQDSHRLHDNSTKTQPWTLSYWPRQAAG